MYSESEARTIIGIDGASQIVDVVQSGWKGYVDDGVKRRPGARAHVVWDNMMTAAESVLLKRDTVRLVPVHQSQSFAFDERLLIRFKKLDRSWRTRNVQTHTQRKLARTGRLDGMPQELVNVDCGYLLDRTESEIEKILIIRRVAGRLEWVIDVEELASGVLTPASPIFDDIDSTTTATAQRSLPTFPNPRRKDATGDEGGQSTT